MLAKVGTVGTGNKFRLHASWSWLPNYSRTLKLQISAGPASWHTGTIRLPMRREAIRRLGNAVRDVYSVTLTIWPAPTANESMRRWLELTGGVEDDLTTCDVYSFAAWGA